MRWIPSVEHARMDMCDCALTRGYAGLGLVLCVEMAVNGQLMFGVWAEL